MRALFVGQIVKSGEIKTVGQNNLKVLNFFVTDIAERNEKKKEWECQVWGKQAENAAQILSVGNLVFIDGSLERREYEDKDKKTRYSERINISEFNKIFTPKAEAPAAPKSAPKEQPKPSEPQQKSPATTTTTQTQPGEDDDLPF